MQRDPNEKVLIKYHKRITYRDFHPLLFWCQCDRCGKEFTREKMYEFRKPSVVRAKIILPRSYDISKYGCTHCFESLEDFENYCQRFIRMEFIEKRECNI